MKHFLLLFSAIFFISLSYSCKKCYTCTNTCVECKLQHNDTLLDVQSICSDSTWYNDRKTALEGAGYTCVKTASTYKDDYCANKSGEDNYLDYHRGGGRYNCVAK